MVLPRVIVHNEVSLDGRIDWFSPHVELYYSLVGQWPHQVVLTGADTVLAAEGDVVWLRYEVIKTGEGQAERG